MKFYFFQVKNEILISSDKNILVRVKSCLYSSVALFFFFENVYIIQVYYLKNAEYAICREKNEFRFHLLMKWKREIRLHFWLPLIHYKVWAAHWSEHTQYNFLGHVKHKYFCHCMTWHCMTYWKLVWLANKL